MIDPGRETAFLRHPTAGATSPLPEESEPTMAQTCDFCGKNRHKAHKVSHSNIKTRKWQQPNLQSIRALIDGQVRRVSACTRCIRSGKVVKAA